MNYDKKPCKNCPTADNKIKRHKSNKSGGTKTKKFGNRAMRQAFKAQEARKERDALLKVQKDALLYEYPDPYLFS